MMHEWSPQETKVLKTFIRNDRIVRLPAKQGKRLVLYQWLAGRIPSDAWIPEVSFNEILRPYHDDVATIRREMYEFGFVERQRGAYRRSSPAHRPRPSPADKGDDG